MKQNKLLTIREVAEELGISEQEVIDLAEEGKMLAYKIGGVYLRFKPEHVQEAKRKISRFTQAKTKTSFAERLQDFLYFNDFYIISAIIVVVLLVIIFFY